MVLFKIRFGIHNNNLLVTSLKKLNEIVNNPTLPYLQMILKRILAITFSCIILLIFNQIFAQTEVNNDYQTAISSADEYFINGDYINAKASYQYAARLKPDEQYPKNRLKETIDRLREKMVIMERYNSEILKADKHFRLKEYEQAKEKYEAAGKILPEESYPTEKIAEIDNIISDLNKKQSGYNEAIKRGEQYIKYKKYEKARVEFEKANAIYPEEQDPKDKISELDTLIEKSANAKEIYTEAIANADRLLNLKYYANAKGEYEKATNAKPDEDYPNSQIKEIDAILVKKNEFDKLVSEADELYIKKNLKDAKSRYQASLMIYPGESYPKGMIDKINASLYAAKDNDELYQKFIADADEFLNNKDYSSAKSEFEKAAALKPSEPYPGEKLAEINLTLANTEAQQNTYQQLIALADQLFAEKKYVLAKIEYQKALKLKPDEKHPAGKISEIDKILKNQSFTLNLYNQTIALADKLYSDGKYDKAISEYQKASAMRQTEQYPKEKIFEINKLIDEQKAIDEQYNKAIADANSHYKQKYYDQAVIRYQDAVQLKPNEKFPQERITEINAILELITKEKQGYTDAIAQGDNLFALQQYEQAKLSYIKAANIKPKEQYPKDKIEEIEQLIATQKASRYEFNRIVAAADRMFESKEYDKAKNKYNEALNILPNEQYPKDKLKEIEDIILAKELAVQETYNNIITEADAFFSKEQYEQAKLKYRDALKYKPEEQYPVQKIAEIERLITDFETLKANYLKLIAEADKFFKAKEYSEAKPKYVEASALMPDEEYPVMKIEEINKIFKAGMLKIQQAYDKAIADADKFFSAKVYDQALDSYRIAKGTKPDETYPEQMINKIMKILNENAVRDIVISPIAVDDGDEKKFNFDPVLISDRKSNFILIKVRNTGNEEFKVIMGYGKGGSKNGGFILPIPAEQNTKEFIIYVGKQYKWFTEDNNWISLTPQGGSVEVSLIKISRGG